MNSRIVPLNVVGMRSTASLNSRKYGDTVERVPTIARRFLGRHPILLRMKARSILTVGQKRWLRPFMKPAVFTAAMLAFLLSTVYSQEVLFQDDFRGKLDEGWSWIREHPEGWRVTERGLEVRVEPGNMWGPQNNARNVLVRPAPDPTQAEIEVGVSVENKPTNQYEQVDLVWYYDDSNMVKLGLELVDGKLSIVMGREEGDKTRTVAIIPVGATSVRLGLFVKGSQIRGKFRPMKEPGWRDVGECSLPVPAQGKAKISLQFYQGAAQVEHWARVTEFRVLKVHD